MMHQTVNDESSVRLPAVACPKKYLVFALQGARYGIDVTQARHIAVLGRVWRIPWTPGFIRGVTMIRDRLLPLVDLRSLLGLPGVSFHSGTHVVELDTTVRMAVAVDSVEGIVRFSDQPFLSLARFNGNMSSGVVAGVVYDDGRGCVLLDGNRILRAESASVRGEARITSQPSPLAATTHEIPAGYAWPVSLDIADLPFVGHAYEPLPDREDVDEADESLIRLAANYPGLSMPIPVPQSVNGAGVSGGSGPATDQRLIEFLARPVAVATGTEAGVGRRAPGFRPGDPRLSALSSALVRMPPMFQAKQAASAVGTLLERSPAEYRLSHFRYDLRKLRVRKLALRIGSTRRYRLTPIGRIICEALAKDHCVTKTTPITVLRQVSFPRTEPAALSA